MVTLDTGGEDGAWTIEIYDQFDHPLTDNPGTGATEIAFEDLLSLNLTSTLHAEDADNDPLDFTGDAWTVGVIDDTPIVLESAQECITVDEDDIKNFQSIGTSPNDGDGDGSETGNPPSNVFGPAFVSGSLAGLVKVGADEIGFDDNGNGTGKFSLIELNNDTLTELGLIGLRSQGDLISYLVVAGDGVPGPSEVLEARASDGRLVFTLEVFEDGDYEFSLHDQMDHDPPYDIDPAGFDSNDNPFFPGNTLIPPADQNTDLIDFDDDNTPPGEPRTFDIDELNLGALIQFEDYDHDAVTLDGDFVVKICDDIPEIKHGKDICLTVDEDDIDTGAPTGSDGNHPNDGNADGSWTGSPFNPADPGPATVFGALGGLFGIVQPGADEPLTFSFIVQGGLGEHLVTELAELAGLSSKGQDLSYDIQGNVLYAYVNGGGGSDDYEGGTDRLVFKFTLQPNGNFSFELHDQIDHDPPNDDFLPFDLADGVGLGSGSEENFDLQDDIPLFDVTALPIGFLIQATDYDGDSVIIGDHLTIKIRDDVPELKDVDPICKTVDEDDISTLADANVGGSLGNHPSDGDADGSLTGALDTGGPATVSGSVAGQVAGGADEPLVFSFIVDGGLAEVAAEALLAAQGLKSQGQNIKYDFQGNVLYGYVGTGDYQPATADRLVFTFTIEPDGDFTFELHDQIDHDPPGDDAPTDGTGVLPGSEENFDFIDSVGGDINSLNFGALIKATDYDGDSVVLDHRLEIKIKDDVPELVGKDCLDAGTQINGADPTDLIYVIPASSNLTIDVSDMIEGADFENTLGFYFADASGNPISGRILSDHAGLPDGDGDVAPLVISAADIPAGAVLVGFFIIPDGNDVNSIAGGEEVTFDFEGGQWVAKINGNPLDTAGDDGVLFSDRRLNPDIDPDGNSDPGDDFEIGSGPRDSNWEDVVDGSDLDFNDLSFNVQVCATPVVFAIVDEDDIDTILAPDALPGGSTGTSPEDGNAEGSFTGGSSDDGDNPAQGEGPAFVSGTLTGLVAGGADENITYSFTGDAGADLATLGLRSQGALIQYQVSGNNLFGFVNLGGGAGTYENGTDRLVFKLTLNGGGSGNWAFELHDQIDHDPPYDTDPAGFISTDDPNYVDNNGHANTPTADQNTDLIDFDDDNTPPGEPRTFDIDTIDFGSIILATDFDKDSVTLDGRFLIQIRDDIPKANASGLASIQVDEDELVLGDNGDLVTGNTDNPPDTVTDEATFTAAILNGLINVGADEPLTWFINGSFPNNANEVRTTGGDIVTSLGVTVKYAAGPGGSVIGYADSNGDDSPAGEREIFRITNLGGNNFQFDLKDKIDHPPVNSGGGDLETLAIDLTPVFSAEDFDHDKVTLNADSIRVVIENDIPIVIDCNIIVNGSFEQGHGLVGNNWEIFASILPGWVMGPDGIPFEVQTGAAGGLAAQDGNALIELDSDTEGNPGNPLPDINPTSNTNATIQQTIAGTVAGETVRADVLVRAARGRR